MLLPDALRHAKTQEVFGMYFAFFYSCHRSLLESGGLALQHGKDYWTPNLAVLAMPTSHALVMPAMRAKSCLSARAQGQALMPSTSKYQ
jgi:hypothetical protein